MFQKLRSEFSKIGSVTVNRDASGFNVTVGGDIGYDVKRNNGEQYKHVTATKYGTYADDKKLSVDLYDESIDRFEKTLKYMYSRYGFDTACEGYMLTTVFQMDKGLVILNSKNYDEDVMETIIRILSKYRRIDGDITIENADIANEDLEDDREAEIRASGSFTREDIETILSLLDEIKSAARFKFSKKLRVASSYSF